MRPFAVTTAATCWCCRSSRNSITDRVWHQSDECNVVLVRRQYSALWPHPGQPESDRLNIVIRFRSEQQTTERIEHDVAHRDDAVSGHNVRVLLDDPELRQHRQDRRSHNNNRYKIYLAGWLAGCLAVWLIDWLIDLLIASASSYRYQNTDILLS